MNPHPFSIDFFQFEAALSEWLDDRTLWRYRSEVLDLYAVGYSVREVAKVVCEVARAEAR